MNDKERNRAIERIKKCLEMSKSSNEHEAAIGMRHAKALMDKYNITIGEEELYLDAKMDDKNRRLLRFQQYLAETVAIAFHCTLFTNGRGSGGSSVKIGFVGTSPAPEIALYTHSVLERQLEQARREYIKGLPSFLSAGNKTKLGRSFSEGWAIGCMEAVEEFAKPVTNNEREQHIDFLSKFLDEEIVESKRSNKSAINQATMEAASEGAKQGKKAKLHAGMGEDEKYHLAHQQ